MGTVGFLVDGGVLQLLVSAADWSPFVARVVSFPAAFTATSMLNRLWTFHGLRMSTGRAYGAYGAIQLVGALINLAVFNACVLIEPRLYERPLVAHRYFRPYLVAYGVRGWRVTTSAAELTAALAARPTTLALTSDSYEGETRAAAARGYTIREIGRVRGLGLLGGPVMGFVWFIGKAIFFVMIQIWIRWTLPRLRVDQLMHISWKVMIPFGMATVLAVGTIVTWFAH